MFYDEFCLLHSGLSVPITASSDPLYELWTALHHSPSRDAVFADLSPLLEQAPPLEKFAALIKSKSKAIHPAAPLVSSANTYNIGNLLW